MSRFTRKHKAYDQRTGRLERAINLIEDGELKGVKVHHREADQEHPLRRPFKVGPDRANLFPGLTGERTYEDAQMRFSYGYTLGEDLWAQRSLPVISWGSGGFVLDAEIPLITSADTGTVVSLFSLAFELTASETVTWGLYGGDDQAQFELSGSTLRWVGNGTQNYNSATDTGADNTYEVIVQATNIDGFYDRQTIVITVTPMSDYMLLGEANGFAIDFIDLTITVRENNGADTLLYNEDEGFAVDFTDGSVTVIEA